MEQPLEACIMPLSDDVTEAPASIKAAYLESALQCLALDLNRLSRKDPKSLLNQGSAAILNIVCGEVRKLLDAQQYTYTLRPAEITMTHADAMLLLGNYKSAIRSFRIERLGENPYGL